MSKNTFNLGDYLKTAPASKPGTAREQIEYIPLDDIDPDPDNFYSLEGLDELAGNIELVGLQQPLRVRPGPGDHVTVVSGHRRRAACLLIRDGGSHMFDGGVPCIVERGDVSREMQELRLIYANSSTRVMTSAELSKQAERVEELLYKLKEQGVEFPGRMRDHVAQAVNASKTKLARLHAIRANLKPSLLAEYDAGRINESVAYRISQEDGAMQQRILQDQGDVLSYLTADGIGSFVAQVRFSESRKADGPVNKETEVPPHPATSGNFIEIRAEDLEESDKSVDELFDDDEDADGPPRASAPTEIRPVWFTGTPPQAGRYFARIDMGDGGTHEAVGEYRGGSWSVFNGPLYYTMRVVGWWPLPER